MCRSKTLCDDCGAACCRYVTIHVGPLSEDEKTWAETRGSVKGEMWRLRSVCEHLDRRGHCRVYPVRPQVCVDFVIGGKLCRAARAAWEKERAKDEAQKSRTAKEGRGNATGTDRG